MTRLRTSPRKEPRQARAQATVEAILVATARVLTREGYDRASTNRIAEEAGVSIGSLYQYFPSKEALVTALIDRHIARMRDLLETHLTLLSTASLPVAVRALVELMIEVHAQNPRLHKVIAEQVPRIGRLNRIHEFEREVGDRVRVLLEGRRGELRTANLDLAAFVLVTIVESLTHRAIVEGSPWTDEELADEGTDLVLRYLLREPERAPRAAEPDGPAEAGDRGESSERARRPSGTALQTGR